jgi:hypothetical protein
MIFRSCRGDRAHLPEPSRAPGHALPPPSCPRRGWAGRRRPDKASPVLGGHPLRQPLVLGGVVLRRAGRPVAEGDPRRLDSFQLAELLRPPVPELVRCPAGDPCLACASPDPSPSTGRSRCSGPAVPPCDAGVGTARGRPVRPLPAPLQAKARSPPESAGPGRSCGPCRDARSCANRACRPRRRRRCPDHRAASSPPRPGASRSAAPPGTAPPARAADGVGSPRRRCRAPPGWAGGRSSSSGPPAADAPARRPPPPTRGRSTPPRPRRASAGRCSRTR